jgi:hypothetical protein
MEIVLLFFFALSSLLGILHGIFSIKRARSNPMFGVKPSSSLFTFFFMD